MTGTAAPTVKTLIFVNKLNYRITPQIVFRALTVTPLCKLSDIPLLCNRYNIENYNKIRFIKMYINYIFQ